MPNYQAKRNNQQNRENNSENAKQSQKEANKKVGKMASKAAVNYFTGGKGGGIVDKLGNTKLGNAAFEKMGNSFAKQNPGLGRIAQKMNDNGTLDKADQALSLKTGGSGMSSSAPVENGPNVAGNELDTKSSTTPKDSSGRFGNLKSSIGKQKNKLFDNDETDAPSGDEEFDSLESNSLAEIKDIFVKYKSIILAASPVLLIIISFFFCIVCISMTSDEDGSGKMREEENNTCTYTSNPNESTKRKVRYTTYFTIEKGKNQYSLGAVGDIREYIKKGQARYADNGYVMWKGGTTHNGKKYGEDGIEYVVVATATNEEIGKDNYFKNDRVHYYSYGDTFTMQVKFAGSKKYTTYNAIVLDSCGACMEWSTTYNGKYSPKNAGEIALCKETEGYKIDIYAHLASDTSLRATDIGYIMDGTANSTCVGEVDLGELVTGIEDTKQLQGKSIEAVYGKDGLTDLNNLIKSNSEKYGSGTGKGVAAAAITLINSLKSKGYRLPYYWAGGHGAISVGAKSAWGSKTSSSCSSASCYYYDSLDCSGFVSWAIRNGGCTNFNSPLSSKSFGSISQKESVKNVKAGDILVNPGHHVVLVVQNNAGDIILAESSGGTGGVHFTKYKGSSYEKDSRYYFIDMSSFYSSNKCK